MTIKSIIDDVKGVIKHLLFHLETTRLVSMPSKETFDLYGKVDDKTITYIDQQGIVYKRIKQSEQMMHALDGMLLTMVSCIPCFFDKANNLLIYVILNESDMKEQFLVVDPKMRKTGVFGGMMSYMVDESYLSVINCLLPNSFALFTIVLYTTK